MWANYGLGTSCGPPSFLIWPSEHAEMMLLVSHSSVTCISSMFQCFQSHFNEQLNTMVVLDDSRAVLGVVGWFLVICRWLWMVGRRFEVVLDGFRSFLCGSEWF